MIRIIHIVSSLGLGSGVMNLLMNYYRNIDRKKIQFDFLYFYDVDGDFKSEITMLGGLYHKIGHPKRFLKCKNNIDNFLKKSEYKYKIIHCHPLYSNMLVNGLVKKHNIDILIQHSHTAKYSNKKLSSLRNKMLLNINKNNITNYVACGDEAEKIFSKKELKKKGCLILNNGIDFEKYEFNLKYRSEIRSSIDILDEKTIVFGNVARFSSEKNHDILINIFKKYHDINSNSKLVLVGNGPLEHKIKDKIQKLNLTNDVIFMGIRDDVYKVINAFDIFILPSAFEGFGIAALEAEANGLLTICSLGVPKDVIISKNSYRFDVYGDESENIIVDFINKNINYNRNIDNKIFIESKYNIKNESHLLEEFYLNLLGDVKYEK